MDQAVIWSRANCRYCDMAKQLLESRGIAYQEKKIGAGYTKEDLLEVVPNALSVPQIFLNDQLIGGYKELNTYMEKQ
jgi:glutaredoxin